MKLGYVCVAIIAKGGESTKLLELFIILHKKITKTKSYATKIKYKQGCYKSRPGVLFQQIQNPIEKEKQRRPWREEQIKGVNQCNGVLCKEIQKLWHRIELKFGSLLGSN